MAALCVAMRLNHPSNQRNLLSNPCMIEGACHKLIDPVNQGLYFLQPCIINIISLLQGMTMAETVEGRLQSGKPLIHPVNIDP